ncbi:MAG: chemotaxis protein CheX [Lachnospiraceae bacterium]|nr:chemotaxis protein CheX [Lachnospiraceae bacterium]MDE6759831.1 chemotaxis protein CheX [Lachnospiraceae bacterium]
MKKTVDVNNINPFLMSTISVFETVTQMKLTVGRPTLADFAFNKLTYTITVGVVGQMKGQAVLAMDVESAKEIASKMMCGMPVAELDDMAASALNELSNMIMGNTATVFSTQGKLIDITPPIAMLGTDLKIKMDIQPICVPLTFDGKEYLQLYICVYEE